MGITPQNFCRVHEAEDGTKVLFYLEHDGDDIVLHQVAICSIGTADIRLSMPAEKWDAIWPDNFSFDEAAAHVFKTIAELDLAVEGPSHG